MTSNATDTRAHLDELWDTAEQRHAALVDARARLDDVRAAKPEPPTPRTSAVDRAQWQVASEQHGADERDARAAVRLAEQELQVALAAVDDVEAATGHVEDGDGIRARPRVLAYTLQEVHPADRFELGSLLPEPLGKPPRVFPRGTRPPRWAAAFAGDHMFVSDPDAREVDIEALRAEARRAGRDLDEQRLTLGPTPAERRIAARRARQAEPAPEPVQSQPEQPTVAAPLGVEVFRPPGTSDREYAAMVRDAERAARERALRSHTPG